MATSGNFLTSDSGQGGGNFYGRTIFEWWRTGWGRSGSQGYHNISFTHKTYGGSGSYWQYFYQGSMNVDGSGYGYPSPIKAYGAGATTLGSGSKTLYTNSAGDRSFGASAQGGVFYNTINTSGSGSWALDNIPMYGGITSVSPTSGITDETSSISVNWFKYTGRATLWFRLDQINNSDTTHRKRNVTSDPYSWTGFQTWVQQTMVNTNSTTLYIYYGDDLDSNGSEDHYNSALTYNITIKNNTGQANPTFLDFDYIDTNSTTVGITGDDQVLIQGKSTLQATVAVADKATPNKNANMSSYLFTIGSYSSSSAWSNVADVVKNIGTVSDVSGVRNLSVKAIDSRTNFKTVTKSVNILPYSSPTFVPVLNVKYTNDYDTSDGITVVADGTKIAGVSPLTLSGVDKNSVNGTTGVQFDVSKGDNTSYTGSWEDVSTSFGTNTGDITTTLATLESDILSKINSLTADNTVKWFVKFKIVDALETQYFESSIDIGRPIFRIGVDGNVYNNEEKLLTSGEVFVEIGRTTLSSTSDSISVDDLPYYKYLRVLVTAVSSGGTLNGLLTFNSDTSANYAWSGFNNGVYGNNPSASSLPLDSGTPVGTQHGTYDIVNIATAEKIINGTMTASFSLGAATAPRAVVLHGKWVNTSNAIESLTYTNSSAGDFAAGSEVVVYGRN